MAEFPIDPNTGMPIVHVDEQQQMERYLAEIAMEDLLLATSARRERPDGALAKYKATVAGRLAAEGEYVYTDADNPLVLATKVVDGGKPQVEEVAISYPPIIQDFLQGVWTPLSSVSMAEIAPDKEYLIYEADHPFGPVMQGHLHMGKWLVPDLQCGGHDHANPTHLMPIPKSPNVKV